MRPYALALIALCASLIASRGPSSAQNTPVAPPSGPVNPAATPALPAEPAATESPLPNAPVPVPPPPEGTAVPIPGPKATAVPISVEPPNLGVSPAGSTVLRVQGVFGALTATVADPALAAIVSIDQAARTVTIAGKAVGATVVTVSDARGEKRDVPLRVAFVAGTPADGTSARVTGSPLASAAFIREAAVAAATQAARLRPGAAVAASADSVTGAQNLAVGDVLSVNVPLQINGNDYFSASGTTRVRVENMALPRIHPSLLLVSDFPETLRENGVLFTADLNRVEAQRFLYFHYNPPGQPTRRILLKAENRWGAPAVVQFISGVAGPSPNEMEVGHLATQRFLVREAQNEGRVITIPANTTVNLVDQLMPERAVVSNLLQLREVEGNPVTLTLVAQNATDPLDQAPATTQLLSGSVKHARGIYRVPEFYFDYTYDVETFDLEIPIGQFPLPNIKEGEALAGDYGVLQSINLAIVNRSDNTAPIALYQNPRGGRATGTYLIDRTLVQSHGAAPFSKFKLREYKVPPHSTFRISVVTMPEGGSSYPLRLIVGPDDGSVSPGGPGSPVY